jgi:prepilin-type processing-associated H-X9-DG protein
MTLMDLAIVLAVLAVLAAFAVTIYTGRQNLRARAMAAQCASNLMGIGDAFRVWADAHGGHFPMSLSPVIDGSDEFTTGTNAWRHFKSLAGYMVHPRFLICPEDTRSSRWPNVRLPARDFTVFGNANLSYFAGLDAKKGNGSSLLSGDRNITNGIGIHDGVIALTTNTPADWTREIHDKIGNVLFADGSVRQLTAEELRAAIAKTGLATNRIQIPILKP